MEWIKPEGAGQCLANDVAALEVDVSTSDSLSDGLGVEFTIYRRLAKT